MALACTAVCPPVSAADHLVAPSGAEFTSIKDAVDWSSGGDTIRVESGTYAENIKLDKKITLIGVDSGNGVPVIQPGKKGDDIEIIADGCTVEGFTIENGASSGIRITSSSNAVRRNTLQNNGAGIALVSSGKNTIENNQITDNNRAGITLESASGNLIQENTIEKNTIGITLDENSISNTIAQNTISNTQNVLSKSPSSVWSTASAFSYTYLGQQQQSRMGNYWNDYRGRDKNGDGIGDSPYIISLVVLRNASGDSSQNIVDAFPLMDPLEYYTGITPGSALPATPLLTATPSGTFPATPVSSTPPVPIKTPASGTPGESGTPAPSQPSASLFPVRNNLPVIPLFVILAGLVIAGIGGIIYLARRNAEKRLAPPLPVVAQAASVLRSAVDRTRALMTTTPSTRTVYAEETQASPQPSATDQKNYFPKELENKYTEIKFVGRGGIAWVFSARRKADGITVAVKIPISFDEITGKCFLNEIAAWETLRHPNIVEVSAVNILPVPYVEMEFVPGSLEALDKPLPVWKAVHLITGVTDGLRYAHEHGFIHRDIKPHNILLTAEVVPKITDWGMSKVLAAEVKKSSVAGFSLSYAAPEQVSPSEFGRTDERTDIYQLGVVFYELVTGSIPFGGESIVEVGNAILREQPIPPSEYNPDAEAVEKIILKCLEKNPADRYQSAAELHDALHGYLDEDDE
ncbi:protein kinase domain-containing protein [Methanoregula sp.]|jgi:parallel beta-helix repeat protein|uniref:protein kinase domain-containing protein n=1 Tax=Methanoregula sp. TaxID=2052170 RepID=UPI003C1AE3E9